MIRAPRLARPSFAGLIGLLLFASAAGAPTGIARAQEAEGEGAEEVQVGVQGDAYADTDPSALTDFRAALDPHGTWVEDTTYGTTWVPNAEEVGPEFQPYVSNGSWAYDDDYSWQSGYEWGWVAFHYGRWLWIDGRGWSWVPGREYAGAWVEWRIGPDGYGYIGWGPLAPQWGWHGGTAYQYGAGWVRPAPPVYCTTGEVFAPRIAAHVVVGGPAATVGAPTHPFVRAEPVGPGRVLHGPPPAMLGIDPTRVVRVSGADLALQRAKAFSRPSTAVAFGARPPTPHIVRARGVRGRVGAPVVHAPPPAVPRSVVVHPAAGGGRGRH